jgi:1,4-dihydroxy-2-naphthoate octaprenyltransferase
MSQLRIWILAARPKTLFAVICPVLVGTTIASSYGKINIMIFLFTLLTGLGIQITTNFWNDYFDFLKGSDTQDRKGPMRITQSGLISLSTMKRACIISMVATALIGSLLLFFGGVFIAILLALSLLLAIGYTAGPIPLAYKGLGDVFVFLFFGPVACLATYYLQTQSFHLSCNIVAVALGSLSTAILAVNNIRDFEEDKKSGKKTLTVRMGITFGKMEYMILLIIPAIITLILSIQTPTVLLSLVYLPFAYMLAKKVVSCENKKDLNQSLSQTGMILFVYTVLFCIGWLIHD